ncbi:flagellar export protein FliJ [Proteiniclasticum sp.]|uniref:flagellar export protein FliJ n=1 Tax=Proteiniclasticum sp. TaxID=2053595 RepID=UPI00289F3074|nr:flagellar export protein FliJ [Proteiniclasticum sp.]
MNYKFKMEKVLEYKSTVEKNKVEDYARINHRLDIESERLCDLEVQFEAKKKERLMDASGLKMQFLYKEKLKTELIHQKNKVEEIAHKADDARDILIEARKDRKIMEMLKDKDRERFNRELLTREQKELDDFSVMRFAK